MAEAIEHSRLRRRKARYIWAAWAFAAGVATGIAVVLALGHTPAAH